MPGRGTGVPVSFMCPRERVQRRSGWVPPAAHLVTLTGRVKPYNTRNHPPRSTNTKREYRCACGHVGWSNHVDLARDDIDAGLADRRGHRPREAV